MVKIWDYLGSIKIPVVLGYASNLLFFLSGFFLKWIIHFFVQRGNHFFFKIFSKNSNIDIIYPTINVPFYNPQVVDQLISIPANVSLMPFAEATGIAEIKSFLEHIFKNKKIQLIPATMVTHQNDIICVGGPSVNLITREFLRNRNYYNHIELVYPDNIIRDNSNHKIYKADIDSEGKIVNDYGVLIIGKNPMNTSRNIFFVFGIWGQGTNVSIKSLINLISFKNRKKIAKNLKQSKSCCILSRADIHELEIGRPEIIDFKIC